MPFISFSSISKFSITKHKVFIVNLLVMKVENFYQGPIQGPVSQEVTINGTIDINRSSMANRVLRNLAINRNPL